MSKGKVLLLGLGMQGKAVLYDLVNNSNVAKIIVADINPDLASQLSSYPSDIVSAKRIDASNEAALESIMNTVDVVIEALPGPFALPMGRLAAKVGVNLISSMYYINPGEQDVTKIKSQKEEVSKINHEAKKKKIIILTEFGMDPGIDLILGAKALSELDEVEEFYSYGAGFPALEAANNPLKYKFSWSIIGVMRSYIRPARIISKGEIVTIPAQEMFARKNMHILNVKDIEAPLECYPNGNSDVYAELFNIKETIKGMGRYSCRWPGHCAFWDIIAKCGFLSEKPIPVNDKSISPAAFTASLLGSQQQFHYADNEQDIALIRIDVRGKSKGKKSRIVYQLIDRRDLATGFTAMQRTVGFTMSLGAQLILEGKLDNPGLLSPIEVPFDLLARGLEKQGMKISREELPWE
jgi:lysine 6-dehydrogenase